MPRPSFHDHAMHILEVLRAVLHAADPAACVQRALADRTEYSRGRWAVVAVGKAGSGMYQGWCEVAGAPAQRLMVVPPGVEAPDWALRGEHPLPGPDSLAAGAAVKRFVEDRTRLRDCDGIVLLLSGGASALASLPVSGLDPEEYRTLLKNLMHAGAGIAELNTVRKHLEELKGGRLAVLAHPLPIAALVLSDVVGDDLSVIASGPVTADASTYLDASKVLRSRGLAPPGILGILGEGLRGLRAETPKPGDPRLAHVRSRVVGSNSVAVEAAAGALRRLGFQVLQIRKEVVGEAAAVGRDLAAAVWKLERGCAVVWGGETTVTVGTGSGRGGRNQELALAGGIELSGSSNRVIAAFATDGVDGATTAAGALACSGLVDEAHRIGVDPLGALREHDSHGLFSSLGSSPAGGLIVTGPTGTNVNDVALGLAY